MRAALSILGLVVAFAIVMVVMKKQAQQLGAARAPTAASAPASGTVPAPEAVRQQVQGLIDQAATRASEAQP